MTTVASRIFRSTPHRDCHDTWLAITDILTQGRTGDARAELLAAACIAASTIADQAPRDAAIVVTCDGPRTRIYCLYDENAIDGEDANEDALGFDPLKGDWRVSHRASPMTSLGCKTPSRSAAPALPPVTTLLPSLWKSARRRKLMLL
jgi:hypothetical protein